MNMKTMVSLCFVGGAVACGHVDADRGGEPPPTQGIEIRAADTKGGLVVAYTTPELSFVLEGRVDDDVSWSRLRGADGVLLTELTLSGDLGRFGGPEMLAEIDEVAASADVARAAEYQLALEAVIAFLADSGDARQAFIDEHMAVPLQQVLLLAAMGNGGASESAPCPDYLADPGREAFHTMADHLSMIAQLPEDIRFKEAEIPCKWYQVCCWHDYACILCGAGMGLEYVAMCGPGCEVGMECMGRCGGGCGEDAE